ncbi:2-dehydro-3-deoxygalactonokinase [Roseivivax sediminis]|uniref:2-keto-3-deoxygalactonate kinase n=1 Tax=Roseivivax sediminis TaxID=936889 RepID=A0A1I1VEV2_9RHOB|nr:2-dehydro-3-deoxygalactonokinase [Roseivivax sediminis]SFD80488.1 2-keto-3-deoxygalactonate kinase [Roseivivax sediminis]
MVWIAADWGTTHLRLWVMDGDAVLRRMETDEGMGRLQPEDYEPTLLGLLRDHIPVAQATEVLAAGMVGARQGWIEAPYTTIPAPPPSVAAAVRPETRDSRLAVHVLPGMRQDDPPDVMRGEEVQIAGLMATEPDFEGIVCLPGTHTKWVELRGGEVVRFRTFMTGELFTLLSDQSVLRLSVGAEGWDDAAFRDGVQRGLARPDSLPAGLFSLRAEALLRDLSPEASRARLSGLLIGTELSAARDIWQDRPLRIVGVAALSSAYQTALSMQGAVAATPDLDEVTLAGFRAAHKALATVE